VSRDFVKAVCPIHLSTDDIGTGTAIFSDEESVNGLPHLPQRC